jgi:signal recognition particle receptor subunit beta
MGRVPSSPMVLFNYATREITAKIVYYGPGLCGKTTNLQFIYDSLPSGNKSKMLSLATKTDRTLFFDFLPLDLGTIRGMRTKVQLYTVPGQVFYNSTRQLVLKGADGIVFVADSQDSALDANVESFQNLEDNLRKQGIRIAEIPAVIQYNKRDLPSALPVEQLDAAINKLGVPTFESVATTGVGVEQTLRGVTQVVLNFLIKKYGLDSSESTDRDLHAINPMIPAMSSSPADSVWADDGASPSASQSVTATAVLEAAGNGSENLPLVATELLMEENPFEDVMERSDSAAAIRSEKTQPEKGQLEPFSMEVPQASIEIPLPDGILDSFPNPEPRHAAEQSSATHLVKEITIPVTLTAEELRTHRRLQLKVTFDINLLK